MARWCWAGGGPPLAAAPGAVQRAWPAVSSRLASYRRMPGAVAAHTRLAVVEEVRPTREAAKAVAQVPTSTGRYLRRWGMEGGVCERQRVG